MSWLKEWAIVLLVLACLLSLFVGYLGGLYQEHRNRTNWKQNVAKEFLLEVEEETRQMFIFDRWLFVKRADGSIVMRRK